MRISVGILAHNEADRIADTVRALLKQTIFRDTLGANLAHVELICLLNGCTDNTAAVTAAVIREAPQMPHLNYIVHEISRAGKGLAWNEYVHVASDPLAEILVFIDADVCFVEADTIERLICCIRQCPEVQVATDVPLKLSPAGEKKFWGYRISRAASVQKLGAARHAICGQLYCGRSEILRSIWLPQALPVEDGFLGAVVKTDGLTRPPVDETILRVDQARHYYKPEYGFRAYLRHEARIVAGSVINSWLFDSLPRASEGGHVGAVVRDLNQDDPEWVQKEISAQIRRSGRWLIPLHFMLWRLDPLKDQPFFRRIKMLPVALAATLANALVCLRANAILRSEGAARHW